MTPANKFKYLSWAEVIDAWRIFPRLFLTACFIWAVQVTYMLLIWYMHLPSTERTLEASGFGGVVFVTVSAFLKFVFNTYTDGGRNWDNVPPVSTTTMKVETTNTKQETP